MSKGPSTFRVTDVRRAVKATESAGLKVGRIELSPGKIIIVPANGAPSQASGSSTGDLDRWIADNARSS
jgi:hypothetical protein